MCVSIKRKYGGLIEKLAKSKPMLIIKCFDLYCVEIQDSKNMGTLPCILRAWLSPLKDILWSICVYVKWSIVCHVTILDTEHNK